jgi:FkbM family methyltransferase
MPKVVKDKRILRGPLCGYRIVTSWHDYPGAIFGRTERPLLDWFEKNVCPGETWLDVGAHYGYTAIALSRFVGLQGRVFAFEPMLSTAGYLAQTRLLNHFPQLTIIPIAIANPETLTLDQLPTTRGMVDSTVHRGDWDETILTARLDWLWSRICGPRQQIDGIKIDVQGMEIEALRGMTELLKSSRPKLVVEVHHGVARAELMNLIEAAGYSRKAVAIEPVEGEIEPQYIDDRSYAFCAAT